MHSINCGLCREAQRRRDRQIADAIQREEMEMDTQGKVEIVNIRLPKELHQQILDRANHDDRSLAAQIRIAVRYYLDRTKPLVSALPVKTERPRFHGGLIAFEEGKVDEIKARLSKESK